MLKTYILIDTISIQEYIFSSNKLKLNLGASHIVAHEIFSVERIPALNKIYDGGGNTLLELNSKAEALDFIKKYSLDILTNFPGLKIGFALVDANIENDFTTTIKSLHSSLKKNKHKYNVNTIPFRSGIVQDCSFTNEGAGGYIEEIKIASHSALAKNDYFEKGENNLIVQFKDVLGKYIFPNKFEDLGQNEGKGYIAVVHIDGNGIGKLFQSIKTKDELKSLSTEVKCITKNILTKLLEILIRNLNLLKDKPNFSLEENTLPFRPVIIGGDDITFVCEGRLGIPLAQLFLELFKKQKIAEYSLEACAGVAIVKTKYPFFKAYEIAEKLLKKAKDKAKSKDSRQIIYPSQIAYEIIGSGNSSPKYDNIYSMDEFEKLLKIIDHFNNITNKWSQTKIMAYREVLSAQVESEESKNIPQLDYYIAHCMARRIELPKMDNQQILKAIELREFFIQLNHSKDA